MRKQILELEKGQLKPEVDDFAVGDTVRVSVTIIEGQKSRVQDFEGIVIARKHKGPRETFTVRKVSYGVGVERIFPLHSPRVQTIKVIRKGKTKRAKLYYLRDRVGKKARTKEGRLESVKKKSTDMDDVMAEDPFEGEEPVVEEPDAEETIVEEKATEEEVITEEAEDEKAEVSEEITEEESVNEESTDEEKAEE
jgi:large subunit ribosomal protein L19